MGEGKCTNMVGVKLVSVTLLVAFAINLHSTDAEPCQLPYTLATGTANTATSAYTTMSTVQQNCAAACFACGQAVGADAADTAGSLLGTAMSTLGTAICPSLTFAPPTADAGADPASFTGTTVILAGTTTATIASLVAPAVTQAFVDVTSAGAAASPVQLICPCLTASANTCAVCGCEDFGLPTTAPSMAPTSFPTQHTDDSSTTGDINLSDDSLSSGAIAGIVIGAVGGSFLFLLIGVLVGGMVGGKSTAAAAPAGQL